MLLALLLPVVEIWLLVQIGHHIGVWPTLAMLVGTAIIGAKLAQAEGLRVLGQLQRALAEQRAPEKELIGAFLVFVGGLLLVLPGVISDVLGVLLLLPPTRALAARILRRRWEKAIRAGRVIIDVHGAPRGRRDLDDEIIDVDAEPVERAKLPPSDKPKE